MVGLLVAIVSSIIAPVNPALADPVSSARDQIAALGAQISADSAHLHQLTVAYDADALQASELAQQARAASTQLQALQHQVLASDALVRHVAVLSYTGEVQTSNSASLSPLVSQAYLDATVGNIGDTEDLLRADQRETGLEVVQLHQAAKAEVAQLSAAASARQQALSQASSEQQALAGDQAHLNALLAELPAPNRPPAVQGLGTGLVSAVQSQVSPPTSAGNHSPASTTLTAAPGTTTAPATTPSTAAPATRSPTSPPTTAGTTSAPPTSPPSTTPTTTPTTGGGAGGPWLALRDCESGDNYQENSGNGYYGAYQFSPATWTALGYPSRPDLEPPDMQDAAAMRLQAEAGWGQWPACSAALGL